VEVQKAALRALGRLSTLKINLEQIAQKTKEKAVLVEILMADALWRDRECQKDLGTLTSSIVWALEENQCEEEELSWGTKVQICQNNYCLIAYALFKRAMLSQRQVMI